MSKPGARSGTLFVFSNRRHTRLKVLCWDGSRLSLLVKRLGDAYRAYTSRVPRWLPSFNRGQRKERREQDLSATFASSAERISSKNASTMSFASRLFSPTFSKSWATRRLRSAPLAIALTMSVPR